MTHDTARKIQTAGAAMTGCGCLIFLSPLALIALAVLAAIVKQSINGGM